MNRYVSTPLGRTTAVVPPAIQSLYQDTPAQVRALLPGVYKHDHIVHILPTSYRNDRLRGKIGMHCAFYLCASLLLGKKIELHLSDINECLSNGGLGPCTQICTNTAGSFFCSCNVGYAVSGYACNGERTRCLVMSVFLNAGSSACFTQTQNM